MTHANQFFLIVIVCFFSTFFMLFSAYSQTDSNVKIPDYCIIDGEVDCSRPECHDICYTPPTPGYERTPFIAPESRLTNDTEEFGADRIYTNKPSLQMPFTYDPLPPEPEEKEVKPVDPPPKVDPQTKKEPVFEECKREKDKRFLFYENQIEFYGSIIKKNDKDLNSSEKLEWYRPYSSSTKSSNDNYQFDSEAKISHIRQYNMFLGQALQKSCFKSGNRCIQGGNAEIRKRINDYFMASYHTTRVRENYLENKMDCLRKCEKESFNAWDDHSGCDNFSKPCSDEKEDKKFLEKIQKYEKEQNDIYNEIVKQRCWP